MSKQPDTDIKPYLEYLKIEMTIMGILSGFSVAAPALIADRLSSAESQNLLAGIWQNATIYVLSGSATMLIAALLFYRQRSLLAWYYGQITLNKSLGAKAKWKPEEFLADSDSWACWISYRQAFIALVFAFFQYGIAFAVFLLKPSPPLSLVWTLYAPLILALIVACFYSIMLQYYRYDDSPWHSLMKMKTPQR